MCVLSRVCLYFICTLIFFIKGRYKKQFFEYVSTHIHACSCTYTRSFKLSKWTCCKCNNKDGNSAAKRTSAAHGLKRTLKEEKG